MGLFRRKKKDTEQPTREPVVVTETPIKDPVIEVIANQEARKETVQEAKKASAELNRLLVQNGFTIKIYLAAQGPANKTRNKGR